ncbi:sodium/hydrogen exchanger 1-like isoform X2 [Silene latifolia]
MSISPLSYLVNLTKKAPDEKLKSQITLFIISDKGKVFGTLTKPLLRLLVPSSTTTNITVCSESSRPKSTTLPLPWNLRDSDAYMAHNIATKSTLGMLITKPTKTVHYYWRQFDRAYIRPLFQA